MPFDAGKLNKRLELQRDEATQDEYGGKTPDWRTIAHLWAEIRPLTGRELFAAHQVHAEVTHRITVRKRNGLTSDLRFLYGTRVFNIATMPIVVDEANEVMEMMCVEEERTS